MRLVTGVAAVVVLVLTGTATPAEASPAELARRTAAATLAEVRAAAAAESARVTAETQTPEPENRGTVEPGKRSTITADGVGAAVTFSGNAIEAPLTVAVGSAPPSASRAARAERPANGTPVSEPVEITATDDDGKQVTQFPAKAVNTRGGGDDGPVVSDVVPGVALQLKPDMARVEAGGLDPSTLRIYTRESAGEPWALLPSYFDAKAGVVRGESTHLSQFIVIGIPFPVPATPKVVLDPDNDEGYADTPAPHVTELPYNIALAQQVAALLTNDCKATVTITRQDPGVPMISRDMRAGIAAAAGPDLTLGIGFNTNQGDAWGNPLNGGSQVYSRGGPLDNAVSDALVGALPPYTTRPAKSMGNNGDFPGNEFAGLPNAFTHLEALFLDHNFDRPVIDNGMSHVADGVLTALWSYLESQGFDCSDPVTGGWPSPPSQAEINRWRQLGHQNHQTYGGEPFSFSTGNLVEDEQLFSLPGQGGSSTDLTLTYNSQDGRASRVGAGWTFGLGARAQRFSDGSVMVVRGDGASFVFASDGHGGYTAPDPGVRPSLSEAGGGRLGLRDVSGEAWGFDASDIEGIGELVEHTDAQGHTTTMAYGAPADPAAKFLPLTSIADSAGQVIQVTSDALGRVTGFIRPGGDRWSLAYDQAGDLTTITLPDGRTKQFAYDGGHQLLTATDPTGTTYLRNQYDGQGRVVRQWDADGNLRTLDYSKAGQTTYTDNLGRTSVYFYDSRSRITKVRHPDGATASFTFDAADDVVSSTDENGARTRYTYDTAGDVTTETAADGTVTRYTYTPTGSVATKTDSGGPHGSARTWSYEYDAAGRLTVVHQPDGTAIENTYDSAGNLVKSTLPSGAATAYEYDAAGRLIGSTDPTGSRASYAYDAAGRMLSQTDPGGHTTTYAWDSGDRLVTATNALGGVFAYGWEPNDHLASLTDPTGAATTYSWDAMFHLTATTLPSGARTGYEYSAQDALTKRTDPLGATTTYTMDARDRVIRTVDPNGGAWTYTYDRVGDLLSSVSPDGATTRYTYDAARRLLAQTDPTGGTTRYRYDGVGRLVSRTDPDGVATSYGYDVMDRVSRVTDGLGKHSELGYDRDGNLVSVVDRQGAAWTFGYDAAGHVETATTPLGEVTRYGYDAVGNLVTVTDALGRTSTSTYDALGLLVETSDPAGNTTRYAYDADGRLASETDPAGHTRAYTYDASGQQVTTTTPSGGTTRYEWDAAGNQTSLTDPLGHRTEYGYDPAGQLVAVTEGSTERAKPGPDVNVTSRYQYDADGDLVSVTDPDGHTTRYAVDPSGRVVSEANPVGGTTKWAYTAAGRVASVVNGNGGTTSYRYDERGDLVWQDQAGAIATYEYSPEQRLIAMTDPTGVSGWVYDKDGRTTEQIDQRRGRLRTAYDAAGQVVGMALPTGQKLDYTYDRAGRVTSQRSPWGSLAYEWDAAGRLSRLARSGGVTTSYGYDPDGRVSEVVHAAGPPAGGVGGAASPRPSSATPVPYVSGEASATRCTTVAGYLGARSQPAAGGLCEHAEPYLKARDVPAAAKPVPDGGTLKYGYSYDADGKVTKATRTIAGATSDIGRPAADAVSYRYDALDRLVGSTRSGGEKNTYAYDVAGNRVGWTRTGASDGNFTQTSSFSDANQLQRSVTTGSGRGVPGGVATYSYDGAGNRVSQTVAGTGTSYAYNPAGQQTEVARSGRTTSTVHDGLGRAASVTEENRYGTATVTKVYDGGSMLQTTSAAHGTTTLVRDAAGALAEHVTDSGDATWDLLDGLGSTVAGATGGSITQLADYDDWGGQTLETAGWSAPEGYTGHAEDPTSGQVHAFARSYDPGTASWTSPDTWRGLLVQPKTLARYSYVEDDPVTQVDPDGHRCAARMGVSDGLLLGCGGTPVRAAAAVKAPPAPVVGSAGRGPSRGEVSKPKVKGPNSLNCVTPIHRSDVNFDPGAVRFPDGGKNVRAEGTTCPAGKVLVTSPYVSPQCIDKGIMEDSDRRFRFGFECDELCRLSWVKFGSVIMDGIGFAPGAIECGASLPLGGVACVNLDPEAGGAFLSSMHDWSRAEWELWDRWWKKRR